MDHVGHLVLLKLLMIDYVLLLKERIVGYYQRLILLLVADSLIVCLKVVMEDRSVILGDGLSLQE